MRRCRKKNTKIERVVIYARVSTVEQAEKDISIPAQIRHAEEYAERKGYEVVSVYEERGVSGTTANRPVLKSMLFDILQPSANVDAVLVYHSSRFMRNVAESQATKAMLEKNGISVIFSGYETPEGPLGKAFDQFTEMMDELESNLNSVRTKSGLSQVAREGFFPGSRPPFGFTREKVTADTATRWKLVPNPEEVPILVAVFTEYLDGLGSKTAARRLNRRGLTYRGKPWSKDKVMKVIGERAAIGNYYWGKKDNKTGMWRDPEEWIAIPVDPILDRDVFDMAQKVRAERDPERNTGRTASSPLLLAGLVTCGKCGASYQLQTSGKVNAQGISPYRYYNCRTFVRIGKEKCSGKAHATEKLEREVLDHIANHVFTDEVCQTLIEDLVEETGVLRQKTAEHRKGLRRELDQVEKARLRWQTAFENGELPADLGVERLTELNTTVLNPLETRRLKS